jgi:hypothetical protein
MNEGWEPFAVSWPTDDTKTHFVHFRRWVPEPEPKPAESKPWKCPGCKRRYTGVKSGDRVLCPCGGNWVVGLPLDHLEDPTDFPEGKVFSVGGEFARIVASLDKAKMAFLAKTAAKMLQTFEDQLAKDAEEAAKKGEYRPSFRPGPEPTVTEQYDVARFAAILERFKAGATIEDQDFEWFRAHALRGDVEAVAQPEREPTGYWVNGKVYDDRDQSPEEPKLPISAPFWEDDYDRERFEGLIERQRSDAVISDTDGRWLISQVRRLYSKHHAVPRGRTKAYVVATFIGPVIGQGLAFDSIGIYSESAETLEVHGSWIHATLFSATGQDYEEARKNALDKLLAWWPWLAERVEG